MGIYNSANRIISVLLLLTNQFYNIYNGKFVSKIYFKTEVSKLF